MFSDAIVTCKDSFGFFSQFFLTSSRSTFIFGVPAIKTIENKIYESGTRQNEHNGKSLHHPVFRFESYSEWILEFHSMNETQWAYICFQLHTNIPQHFSFSVYFWFLRPCAPKRTHFIANYIFMIWKYHFRYAALFIIIAARKKEINIRRKKATEYKRQGVPCALKIMHRTNEYEKCAEKDCPQWK